MSLSGCLATPVFTTIAEAPRQGLAFATEGDTVVVSIMHGRTGLSVRLRSTDIDCAGHLFADAVILATEQAGADPMVAVQ